MAPSVFAAVVEDTLRPVVAGWIDSGFGFPTSEGHIPVISYVDDIFLLGKDKNEVEVMMREGPAALLEAGLSLQMAKSEHMVICVPVDEVPLCL